MVVTKQNLNNSLVRVISGEKFTPYSLYKKLGARALLESASFSRGKARFSIILVRETFSVQQNNGKLSLLRNGEELSIEQNSGDILDILLRFARQHAGARSDIPFPAGGIGYLSYEYARHFDDIGLREKADRIDTPEALFLFGNIFLIFDHYTDTIAIVALNYDGFEIDLQKAVKDTEERIHDLDFNYLSPHRDEYECISLIYDEKERFLRNVVEVRREIKKGSILQGVLSRRVRLRTDMPALEAYRRLRSLNPSPYMFFLDFDKFQLFGSSPEMHVKVDRGRVISRPIAGTRRRGKTSDEDERLKNELLQDEKERAEHLMLVDLARNDLGRICRSGSVRVTEFMGIEHYSHVIHIVSQVEGDLMKDTEGIEAVRKTFPAGTVSGAPKIRAMEIIDSLEEEKRGFYAGIVGYLEPDGSLDTCITIRSALKKDDMLVLQAGAGIVYDSVPERELSETSSKLRALGKSLGVEV
jgi:anthranilate synthase component 1